MRFMLPIRTCSAALGISWPSWSAMLPSMDELVGGAMEMFMVEQPMTGAIRRVQSTNVVERATMATWSMRTSSPSGYSSSAIFAENALFAPVYSTGVFDRKPAMVVWRMLGSFGTVVKGQNASCTPVDHSRWKQEVEPFPPHSQRVLLHAARTSTPKRRWYSFKSSSGKKKSTQSIPGQYSAEKASGGPQYGQRTAGVPRKKTSMTYWSVSTAPAMATGTSSSMPLVHQRLDWKDRFLRNSAPACAPKEASSLPTRSFTWVCETGSVEPSPAPALSGRSGPGMRTVAVKEEPGTASGGIVATAGCPCTSICTWAPGLTPSGTVTETSSFTMPRSSVSTGIRRPSSSVPHTTENIVLFGDLRVSSLPRSTPTSSPVFSVTVVFASRRRASSASASFAIRRNTSSRDDIPTCTSTTPRSSERSSSMAKKAASRSSSEEGTLKCMYAFDSSSGTTFKCSWKRALTARHCTPCRSWGSPHETDTRYPAPKRVLRRTAPPMHRSRPLAMIAMRSPRMSASSIECVVRMMVRSCLAASMTSHTCRRLIGSIPVVGSSRYTT
mmetsp:Transcript_34582/g.78852  ORF Transcript_34582/g.78852 Transcript_34582/m.78852 type:complete len:555 (-) Transcript_34582:2475-4139(-)